MKGDLNALQQLALQTIIREEMRASVDKENREFKAGLYTRIMGDHLPPSKIFEMLKDEDETEISEDGYEIQEIGDEEGFSTQDIAFMQEQSRQFQESIDKIQAQGYAVEEY